MTVVLYGCGTWSLTLREEYRLRVFENRVLRRIFGLKTDEVTGEWRRLHNEELYAPYSTSNIIRVIKSIRMSTYGRGEVHTGFWGGESLRKKNHLKGPRVDGRILLKWILQNFRNAV